MSHLLTLTAEDTEVNLAPSGVGIDGRARFIQVCISFRGEGPAYARLERQFPTV